MLLAMMTRVSTLSALMTPVSTLSALMTPVSTLSAPMTRLMMREQSRLDSSDFRLDNMAQFCSGSGKSSRHTHARCAVSLRCQCCLMRWTYFMIHSISAVICIYSTRPVRAQSRHDVLMLTDDGMQIRRSLLYIDVSFSVLILGKSRLSRSCVCTQTTSLTEGVGAQTFYRLRPQMWY